MGTEDIKPEELNKTVSDLDRKIIHQIEYYFGNYNLQKDRFLREHIKADDGWIPVETLLTFNRLKSLTEDGNVVCEAMKKSDRLMEVSEDCTKMRRRVDKPVPDESYMSKDAVNSRSLYVKGFKKTVQLDELLEFFKDHNVSHVTMRHDRRTGKQKAPFKGSCFVVFDTPEDADKFLALQGVKFENVELLKEKKNDYTARKDIFYDNLRAEKAKKQAEKAAENNENSQNNEVKVTGCLLKLTGFEGNVYREKIAESFEAYGSIAYIDFNRGDKEAVIRFETGIAADVLEKAEEEDGVKKFSVGSLKVSASLVEGDAEIEYWKNIAIRRASSRQMKRKFSGKRGDHWRNKHQHQKRQKLDENNDGEQTVKKVKEESEKANEDGQKPATTEDVVMKDATKESVVDSRQMKEDKPIKEDKPVKEDKPINEEKAIKEDKIDS